MSLWRRLRGLRAAIVGAALRRGDHPSVRTVDCPPGRRLPRDRPIARRDRPEEYAAYWETRFLDRLLIMVPYSHSRTLEDPDHPDGLQRYHALPDLLGCFLRPGLVVRDLNFAVCTMPGDGAPRRSGHFEEAPVVPLRLEKRVAPA